MVTPHQQLTHEWWGHHRPQLEAYISTLVIQEAETGDTSSVANGRLEAIEDFPVLEIEDICSEQHIPYIGNESQLDEVAKP